MSIDVLNGFIADTPPKTLKGKGKISDFGKSNAHGYDWQYRRSDGVWEDVETEHLIELLTAPDLKTYLLNLTSV